jgi:hypothetical protein
VGVACDVGESFLDSAVGCHLHGSWQGRPVLRSFYREKDRFVFSSRFSRETLMSDEAVAFRLLADRSNEPQIVERWRPEAVNQAPHVAYGLLRLVLQA